MVDTLNVVPAFNYHTESNGFEEEHQSLRTDWMATGDLVVGMVFLSQTILGILGNFSLLCHYLLLHFTGCRARCTDLILRHLTIANSLVIITKGVPQTMAAFGLKYYSQDFRCSLLFFVQRVARGVSMESTCLLSVFLTLFQRTLSDAYFTFEIFHSIQNKHLLLNLKQIFSCLDLCGDY